MSEFFDPSKVFDMAAKYVVGQVTPDTINAMRQNALRTQDMERQAEDYQRQLNYLKFMEQQKRQEAATEQQRQNALLQAAQRNPAMAGGITPQTYGEAYGGMQVAEMQRAAEAAQDTQYQQQAKLMEAEFKSLEAQMSKITGEGGDVSPYYRYFEKRSADLAARYPNNPYLARLSERMGELAKENLKVPAKKTAVTGAANLRVANEAQRMVDSGEAESVEKAMPQAAENIKQRDEEEKDVRRIAAEDRRYDRQIALQMRAQAAADARLDKRLQLSEFNTSVRPVNSAYAQAAKFSLMAGGFEKKIEANVGLLKEWLSDYEKKHPVAKYRAGALINDLIEGKIKGEGKYANINTIAESIGFELGKLESGSYGSAGATKRAVDAFDKLKASKGIDNMRKQLDGILSMSRTARKAQDEVASDALNEVNAVRSQYGLPNMKPYKSSSDIKDTAKDTESTRRKLAPKDKSKRNVADAGRISEYLKLYNNDRDAARQAMLEDGWFIPAR